MNMILTIVSFAVVLGILIFIHELGHFLMARLFGVGVEKFSLGFGPKIFGKQVGITDYRISALPLGGYVKMVGEEPDADIDPEDIPISFTHKSVYKRIMIVAAGPLFNLLLAVVIFFVMFQASGSYIVTPLVGKVGEGTPAEKAGLLKGDRVAGIDGLPVETWNDMVDIISNCGGKVLEFKVKRGDETLSFTIRPDILTDKNLFGEEIQRYVIGITASDERIHQPLNPIQAFTRSLDQTYFITKITVVSIVKLLQGSLSPKTLGGPIMIAQMSGQQAKEGISNLIFWIALLSINLGILNFLPIPVLDGGHLLFFFIEAIIGRPVNVRMREIANQIGIFVLLLLMIYVFYNDITRVFFS